ncbi:hypothetical protein CR513_23044, partial [Mucuna pruriens]
MFSICLCARFQLDPRKSHLKVVKRIFRYLISATNLCLLHKKNQDFRLVGYCDANYARDKIKRKSTEDFIRPCVVSWASKKQNSVALSIVEIAYILIASCCSQLFIEIMYRKIQIINEMIYAQNLYMKNALFSKEKI